MKNVFGINDKCFHLPGPTLKFPSEIGAVRSEVEKLKADGVRIIIGLSHSGYTMDQRVAAEVDGLDIIVGGHSHSFLYTGKLDTRLTDGGAENITGRIFCITVIPEIELFSY